MAGTYSAKGDTLTRKANDPGYRVAWKHPYGFQKGHFDEEMTYGEAKKRAEELQAGDAEHVYWPELIMR